ncbi:hypothetical protein OG930_34855 [Streptomyces sp. NBC_01799]|nr:hypothetical protein OG930_34855 [Streptomyces sp. NBC_01799]
MQLHPDLTQESLDAATDTPPADPAARRAYLARTPHPSASSEAEPAAGAAKIRRQRLSLAAGLKAFGPGMFGVVTEKDEESFGDYEGTAQEDAQLAADVRMWATDVMLDQLFMNVQTLTGEETNVAECEGVLWHLGSAPPLRPALRRTVRPPFPGHRDRHDHPVHAGHIHPPELRH